MTLEKKKKAALAAVAACMRQESASTTQPAVPTPGPSPWGQSGRLSGMEIRNLMQLKALHRK